MGDHPFPFSSLSRTALSSVRPLPQRRVLYHRGSVPRFVVFEPVQSHTCLLLIDPVDDSASDLIAGPLPADQAGSPTAVGRPMKPVRRKSRLTFFLLICWIRTQFIAERKYRIFRCK